MSPHVNVGIVLVKEVKRLMIETCGGKPVPPTRKVKVEGRGIVRDGDLSKLLPIWESRISATASPPPVRISISVIPLEGLGWIDERIINCSSKYTDQ